MTRRSPLHPAHLEAEALLIPYGPAESPAESLANTITNHPTATIQLVATFGELELEYAALRKACILLDQPHRGLIELTGPDRLDFLNRMLTQELKGLQPNQVRRSFWLNRKGRIDADLRVIHLEHRTLLELDAHAVARTLQSLASFIITEDVRAQDLTDSTHRLSLHGPTAELLLNQPTQSKTPDLRVSEDPGSSTPGFSLKPAHATTRPIANTEALIFRDDTTGEPGYELILPAADAARVYQHLVESGSDPNQGTPEALTDPSSHTPGSRVKLRQAGWHAYNIARIEAGTPLYNIDFGPTSLPAETGVLLDRVSFTKGCYLGQEIVARMHARGHPKQQLVALKLAVQFNPADGTPRQPESGAAVLRKEATDTNSPVGAVTSSTTSPMLGAAAVCFAQVRHDLATPGTELQVVAHDAPVPATVPATVQPTLTFWSHPS